MLHETYRPRDWGEVVGQDALVASIQALESRSGLSGRAYWISGKSGGGKTTIARLIAQSVSSGHYINEMDAKELTAGALDTIKADMAYVPMGCETRAYIVNEAHGLRADMVTRLLGMLEAPVLNSGTLWVFTTTIEGDQLFDGHLDSHPLKSRCMEFELAQRGVCLPMAARCREIALKEGLDGQGIGAYERLLKDKRNNMRAALQSIEAGAMLKG